MYELCSPFPYDAIGPVKNEGLGTKIAEGYGLAYSALEQAMGPAVLGQAKSASPSGRCRALAKDQCWAPMGSLQLGTRLSVLHSWVQSLQKGPFVPGE